jgi:hypothetical protein
MGTTATSTSSSAKATSSSAGSSLVKNIKSNLVVQVSGSEVNVWTLLIRPCSAYSWILLDSGVVKSRYYSRLRAFGGV